MHRKALRRRDRPPETALVPIDDVDNWHDQLGYQIAQAVLNAEVAALHCRCELIRRLPLRSQLEKSGIVAVAPSFSATRSVAG